FSHVIYGEHDTPLLKISPNSSVDPTQSHPAYSTAIVAPGEINDRYRHGNPSQSIGYAMGSLKGMYIVAELLRNAGYDPYAYRGSRDQSLVMATSYYACFGKHVGFGQIVTSDNARACPDAMEYVGTIVNDVETSVLIGAARYSNATALTELV